jgi:transcriptional regulator with XRE-family HTH domain
MDAARLLRTARTQRGLSLRILARRASTSHSTLAAYEAGRKQPTVETFGRIVRAAGLQLDVTLAPSVGGADPGDRGRELAEALELAEQFPARPASALPDVVFGRT